MNLANIKDISSLFYSLSSTLCFIALFTFLFAQIYSSALSSASNLFALLSTSLLRRSAEQMDTSTVQNCIDAARTSQSVAFAASGKGSLINDSGVPRNPLLACVQVLIADGRIDGKELPDILKEPELDSDLNLREPDGVADVIKKLRVWKANELQLEDANRSAIVRN